MSRSFPCFLVPIIQTVLVRHARVEVVEPFSLCLKNLIRITNHLCSPETESLGYQLRDTSLS
jgi:hypothetical protein